jgi:ADP-ribose pyrophosphatase
MKAHGPWQIVASHAVYRDPWIALRKDDVIRPDGQTGTYSVVDLKPGVCVLAFDHGFVYLTEEFHYGVGRDTIEAVSGGIEPGEDAQDTAQRELREELGIEAAQWLDWGMVDPFTASVVSPTRLYLARGLQFVEPNLEGTELIRRARMSLTEAVRMVMGSEITHAPSCVLILKARLLLEET